MKRTRKSARGIRTARQLRFEPLENRTLLAVAAFTVNLYEDVGGAPGHLITDDTVEVSDTFFVEIMARELHPLAAGLGGVALDIAWDPSVLEEIDVGFDPNDLITPSLPVYRNGVLDNEAGTIDNLSAYAILSSHLGRPIGNLFPERFALLHFRAKQPAEYSMFSMGQGRSRIATVPVSSLHDEHTYFEPQKITVVAGPALSDATSVITTVDSPDAEADVEPQGEADTDTGAPDLPVWQSSPVIDCSVEVNPDDNAVVDSEVEVIQDTTLIVAELLPEEPVGSAESSDSIASGDSQPVDWGRGASSDETATRNDDSFENQARPSMGIGDAATQDSQGEEDAAPAVSETVTTWQNPGNPPDVNGIDGVTPFDVLITVNYINANPDNPWLPSISVTPPPFYDVNGDSACTAFDVLVVVNSLNSPGATAARETDRSTDEASVPPTLPVPDGSKPTGVVSVAVTTGDVQVVSGTVSIDVRLNVPAAGDVNREFRGLDSNATLNLGDFGRLNAQLARLRTARSTTVAAADAVFEKADELLQHLDDLADSITTLVARR